MSRSYTSRRRTEASGGTVRDRRLAFTTEQRRLARALSDALDPSKAPSKPKTFADMTEAEKAEMRRIYEGKKP